ncbi:MAG: hypothetical protein Q9169_003331 [Polycauliona sp. 2 TL-2023]
MASEIGTTPWSQHARMLNFKRLTPGGWLVEYLVVCAPLGTPSTSSNKFKSILDSSMHDPLPADVRDPQETPKLTGTLQPRIPSPHLQPEFMFHQQGVIARFTFRKRKQSTIKDLLSTSAALHQSFATGDLGSSGFLLRSCIAAVDRAAPIGYNEGSLEDQIDNEDGAGSHAKQSKSVFRSPRSKDPSSDQQAPLRAECCEDAGRFPPISTISLQLKRLNLVAGWQRSRPIGGQKSPSSYEHQPLPTPYHPEATSPPGTNPPALSLPSATMLLVRRCGVPSMKGAPQTAPWRYKSARVENTDILLGPSDPLYDFTVPAAFDETCSDAAFGSIKHMMWE